jgi:hypothetical protein
MFERNDRRHEFQVGRWMIVARPIISLNGLANPALIRVVQGVPTLSDSISAVSTPTPRS